MDVTSHFTRYRSYWVHTKLGELDDVGTISGKNEYRFAPLSQYPPTAEGVLAAMGPEVGPSSSLDEHDSC